MTEFVLWRDGVRVSGSTRMAFGFCDNGKPIELPEVKKRFEKNNRSEGERKWNRVEISESDGII